MTDQRETVLLAWARDADGGCQRFTGERIFQRAGKWCHDRLIRNIPVIVTYQYRLRQAYFAIAMGIVPDAAVPLLVYLRKPGKVDERGGDSPPLQTWLVYEHLEDA